MINTKIKLPLLEQLVSSTPELSLDELGEETFTECAGHQKKYPQFLHDSTEKRSLTNRAGETPKHWAPGCHCNKNLDDRTTSGVLHSLTVLREGVYLDHQETLQH